MITVLRSSQCSTLHCDSSVISMRSPGMAISAAPPKPALTTFGEELLLRVREILRSVDELGDFARATQDRLAGRLRVGMIPTIAPYLVPKGIENFPRLPPRARH